LGFTKAAEDAMSDCAPTVLEIDSDEDNMTELDKDLIIKGLEWIDKELQLVLSHVLQIIAT